VQLNTKEKIELPCNWNPGIDPRSGLPDISPGDFHFRKRLEDHQGRATDAVWRARKKDIKWPPAP